MSVQSADYHKANYGVIRAMGAKAISSDATLQIVGYEAMWLLCKQFPHPVNGVTGEIEIPGPNGIAMWQPQQTKLNYQGPISMTETEAGHVSAFLSTNLAQGAKFDAWVYEGTPDRYTSRRRIVDAFIVPESPDRDWENRSQVLSITGTLFYHYFGDVEPGNVSSLTTLA